MHKQTKLILIILLIIVGLASRFFFLIPGFPEWPNFSAVGAVALFGAFHLKNKWALLLPLAILWLSDIILNNLVYSQYFESFSLIGDLWVYVSFVATVVLGFVLLKKLSFKNLVGTSLAAAILFYLITNFAVWISTPAYPLTWSGFVDCYLRAIPFFRNALLGNLFYSFLLFGAYELVTRKRISYSYSIEY
jgi:hypothetical protein